MTKKKKTVKSKLFDVIKSDNSEKEMLLNFIKVGTDITMVDTTHSKQYLSDFAFNRRTVSEIDGYKIMFERDNSEIGYFRHPSYLLREHKLTIKKETENRWFVTEHQDGHRTYFILENY